MESLVHNGNSACRTDLQETPKGERKMTEYSIYDPVATRRELSKHPDYEKFSAESADEMMQEGASFWLNIYRKRRQITQKMIAKEMFVSQSAVCQMLKKPATIGTLWRLCNAMGAQLEINIRFEGEDWKSLIYGDDPLSPEDQAMVDAHRAAEEAAKADK
jgi:transcriptional regulator with XRE-family HTH domain